MHKTAYTVRMISGIGLCGFYKLRAKKRWCAERKSGERLRECDVIFAEER